MSLAENIKTLKKEKNVLILAHYYTEGAVQDAADYVGDSYYLSKIAAAAPQQTILFCGVRFMGESAKILSPEKRVFMAEASADCPMAHMIGPQAVEDVRARYDDLAVVCYINSTTEVKAVSDVCVTSSNALKIVSRLPQKNILFIPDENLGDYIAQQLPQKNFVFQKGFCPIHQDITKQDVEQAKRLHPQARVLAHPECRPDVVRLADFAGSTSAIIDFATESPAQEFIILTVQGILHQLRRKNPEKTFYFPQGEPWCKNMKRITLEKVSDVLQNMTNEVVLDEDLRKKAMGSLQKMHALAE